MSRTAPATRELATVMRLANALLAKLVNVGHGRGIYSVRCANVFVEGWEAAGGEVGTVTSWPAVAASWQRPACRLAAGTPDVWIVADEADGWEAFLPRLAATSGWRACRTVAFAHLVDPRPPRFPRPGRGRRPAGVVAGRLGVDRARRPGGRALVSYRASWKMMPSTYRLPECTRLTLCRIATRRRPRAPGTGRWWTGKTSA